MTATEYVEDCLKEEECLNIILELFPSFTASFLPPPKEDPQMCPKTDEKFEDKVHEKIEEILAVIQPKSGINGSFVNGPLLAELIYEFEKRINEPGTIPNVENSWYSAIYLLVYASIEDIVEEYKKEMEKLTHSKFPMEVGAIEDSSESTLCGCHNIAFIKAQKALDDHIKKLVPSSSSQENFSKPKEKLHQYLCNQCGHRKTPKADFTGKLELFYIKNFECSKDECTSIFQAIYIAMHDKVDIGQMKVEYYEKTKSKGPAKEMVYENELKLIPGPPTCISILETYSDYVVIMWNKPNDRSKAAKEYEIKMSYPKAEWKRVQNMSMKENGFSAQLTDLCPFTNYTFFIRGRNEQRTGECSNEIPFQTSPGKPHCPQAPHCSPVSESEVSVTVNPEMWQENGSEVNAITYKWCFKNHTNNIMTQWYETKRGVNKPNVAQNVTVESFDEEGVYLFAVQLINSIGCSEDSPHFKIETLELIPGAPTEVEPILHVNALELKWKPPDLHQKAVKFYGVKIKKFGNSEWQHHETVEDACTCRIESLRPNTKYAYEITSHNYKFKGKCSNAGVAVTKAGHPEKPREPILRVTSSQKVSISVERLSQESENGKPVTNVDVEASVDGNTWTIITKIKVSPLTRKQIKETVEFCSDCNNSVKVYRYFRVYMENEMGVSEASEEAYIEDTDLIPSAPMNLTVMNGSPREMTIEWNIPIYNSHAITQYCIKLGDGSNSFHEYVTPEKQFHFQGLKANTCYHIMVQSQNSNRMGESSDEICHRTPFAPPDPPSRGQVNIEVITDNKAKCCVDIPPIQPGQKKISSIRVETCKQDSNNWEFDTEETNTCPEEGGNMEFETGYARFMRFIFKSDVGYSEPSGTVTLPKATVIPGVPINFKVTASSTNIFLSWDKPQVNREVAKRYRIEQMDMKSYSWSKLVSVNECKFCHDKVDPCKTIQFRVCAKNGKQVGDYSDVIQVKTSPPKPKQPGLTMLTHNTTKLNVLTDDLKFSDKVSIEWKEKDKEWESKVVEREKFEPDVFIAGNSKYVIEFNGTPLFWRIKLHSENKESEYSDELKCESNSYIALPPQNLSMTNVSETGFQISWELPGLIERIERYVIVLMNTTNGKIEKHQVLESNSRAYTVKNLHHSTNYLVTVFSENSVTIEKQGIVGEICTLCPDVGPPLHLKKAGATPHVIKIRWHPPKNEENVSKYMVYYKRSTDRHYKLFQEVSNIVKSQVVNKLTPNTEYDFKIVAINKNNKEGGFSELIKSSTKHGKATRRVVEALVALPTLGMGSVALSYRWASDKDVRNSY